MTSENPGPSTSTLDYGQYQVPSCSTCRSTFYEKEILRLIFRERDYHVIVLTICLTIQNGVITNTTKDIVNYCKLRHDEEGFYSSLQGYDDQPYTKLFDALDCINPKDTLQFYKKYNRKMFCQNILKNQTHVKAAPKNDGEIVMSFLKRFATNLNLDVSLIKQSIENIFTSTGEILIDLNLQKLKRITKRRDSVIKDIVRNMFWQPNAYLDDNSDSEGNKTWFLSVDKGYVVPFHENPYFNFPTYNQMDEILLMKCAHDIEQYSPKFLTWYLESYFYDNDMHPRVDSYTKFLRRLKEREITNSLVTVVHDNPLLLGSNFAYVVASNFHTNQKYLREYMSRTTLVNDHMIYFRHEIPFIVRSLDPITRMHTFHMVYKDKICQAPTYENLFRVLVLLRDVMLRMQLRRVVMPKIGRRHDQLDFRKVLKMINYVFCDSHINVIIGLKTKRWFWTGQRKSSNSSEE